MRPTYEIDSTCGRQNRQDQAGRGFDLVETVRAGAGVSKAQHRRAVGILIAASNEQPHTRGLQRAPVRLLASSTSRKLPKIARTDVGNCGGGIDVLKEDDPCGTGRSADGFEP